MTSPQNTQSIEEATLVSYRFGSIHAERKDLDVTGVEPPKHVDVKFDFDVKAPFGLESAEADIKIERDLWDSKISVRVKGTFQFDHPFDTVESAEVFVKSVALTRTFHVCLAEVDRLARELDVTVLAVPLDIEEGLQQVKPEFVGDDRVRYEDYDPSFPPKIAPEWEPLGEDRSGVERTHSWDEVADDFAAFFDISKSELLGLIQDELDEVGAANVATVEDMPTDTEACEFIHHLWTTRQKR